MVGVPRSGACQLCRKRRVKCDEQRPACGNCQKYGAECPGYDRGRKFIDGKHQIRQKGKRSDRSSTETSESSSSTSNSNASRTVVVSRKSQSLVTPLARALLPLRSQIMEIMIDNFRPVDTPHDIIGLFSWISHDHLGKKAILDGSICSLALHLTGKEKNDPQLVAQSRTLYGHCLQELQMTLEHPTEWKSSETLCSTILLCYYEVVLSIAYARTAAVADSLSVIRRDEFPRYLAPALQRHRSFDEVPWPGCPCGWLGSRNASLFSWHPCMFHYSPSMASSFNIRLPKVLLYVKWHKTHSSSR